MRKVDGWQTPATKPTDQLIPGGTPAVSLPPSSRAAETLRPASFKLGTDKFSKFISIHVRKFGGFAHLFALDHEAARRFLGYHFPTHSGGRKHVARGSFWNQ